MSIRDGRGNEWFGTVEHGFGIRYEIKSPTGSTAMRATEFTLEQLDKGKDIIADVGTQNLIVKSIV